LSSEPEGGNLRPIVAAGGGGVGEEGKIPRQDVDGKSGGRKKLRLSGGEKRVFSSEEGKKTSAITFAPTEDKGPRPRQSVVQTIPEGGTGRRPFQFFEGDMTKAQDAHGMGVKAGP